jgi:predicted Zn-dependent protease
LKAAGICPATLVMFASYALSGQAAAQTSSTDSADRLFQVGQFSEAAEQYAQIAAAQPDDYSATHQLGRIALLSIRLDDAREWLEGAIALRPGDADPKVMLAVMRAAASRSTRADSGVLLGMAAFPQCDP